MSLEQMQLAHHAEDSAVISTTAISIRDLSKIYPVPFARVRAFFRRTTKKPVQALTNVSLEVSTGEIFGLIGRNGAGKTTLTKIIATLVQPTSGTVGVFGYDSVRSDEQVRRLIGLATAEERSFYWRLNPVQNLMFFARLHGLSGRIARQRIDELFEQLELHEVAGKRFGELSTGNKQRLAVARALLSKPPVLLLDEPTRSLDPLAAERVRDLIKSLSRQDPPVTILFTSHNLGEVETLCARVAIISRGRIRGVDSPANLRRLTQHSEKVRVTVGGKNAAEVKNALAYLDIEEVEPESESRVRVTFTRESGDNKLDLVLRELQQNNASIIDIESEKASLLDLLTRYENDSDFVL